MPGGVPHSNSDPRTVRFGVFEADPASGALFKRGIRVRLQDQPFQVLAALLERPQQIVTREELQQRLWPDSHVDFERGLNKAINRLREALGDDADNPCFIETVPQRGYRFLLPVETAQSEPETPPASDTVSTRHGPSRRSVFAIAAGAGAVSLVPFLYHGLKPAGPRIESLAVLPLENVSGDPAQEYFSDGMTDELIGEIGRVSSLRVISRTSVMRYRKGVQKSLREIAGELNVHAILEGSVALIGREVRINLRLIRASDDKVLWSGGYAKGLTAVLALQNEVARSVAREIRSNLSLTAQNSPARTRTVGAEAYQAFLKGNYFLHQGLSGITRSIDWFTEATRLDTGYAAGHAGLAEALVYAAIFGLLLPHDAFPKARVTALSAIAMDASSAPAHTALGDVKKGYDWDLTGAETEFRRALDLDSNHLLAIMWYADCLSRMNRHDEALQVQSRVLALDPVSANGYGNRAMLLYRARRYDEAIRMSQQSLELTPNFVNARWWQGLAYAGKGDFAKSVECLSKAAAVDPGPIFRALLGHVYGLSGDRSNAQRILEELTRMGRQRFVSPMDFAIVHAGLGDADSTFQHLFEACRTRAARMHEVAWVYFDRIRPDPRYADILRRVGLQA